MNKVWIGTNWKMHKTLQEGKLYCNELMDVVKDINPAIEVFIIPSYTSLWPIKELISDSRIRLGAQNMHWAEEGAFTGEISPIMLSEIGLDLIELGHSERRQYFNERDEELNKKVQAAIKHGMKPLLCIGENMEQKNNQITIETLSAQLKVCLNELSADQAKNMLIAYEPVWAIGKSGVPADSDYVAHAHFHIRRILGELFGSIGNDIPILYGGSVNESNFLEYLQLDHVNGLFIGRAAWDMNSFRKIILAVDSLIQH
jgi:triosephosphate isomerase